jgi:hypothetical protein
MSRQLRPGRAGGWSLRAAVLISTLSIRANPVGADQPDLWLGSVQGGPVDELQGAVVQGPVLDQFQVEVGRILEDPPPSVR